MARIDEMILRNLYVGGDSMMDIAKKLSISQHKVVYWMDKYRINRRSWSEAAYLKANPNGDPFSIDDSIIKEYFDTSQFLLGLGLGIYWGEGTKVNKNRVAVANSDPAVLLAFRSFLLTICNLEVRKILYSIVCFNDADPNLAAKHWSDQLSVPVERFGKIVQIFPQGKGTYRKKSSFGVCTMTVGNFKLKSWVMRQLAFISDGFLRK